MSECNCGAKTIQPEHHKFGCPFRHPGSMAQYTSTSLPTFEDITRVGAGLKGLSIQEEIKIALVPVEAVLDEIRSKLLPEARAWAELFARMRDLDAERVRDLPEDDQRYWKNRLAPDGEGF